MTKEIVKTQSQPVQLGTLAAATPKALVAGAAEAANALADVVKKAGLSVNIQGRQYVRVEGWTTLGTMLGVVAREVETKALQDGSYVSTVELVRMSDGAVISRASAECGGPREPTWQRRPPYARRSMAQTRATGKACRLAFSWIMALAGYEATPAEEMDGVAQEVQQEQERQRPRAGAQRRSPSRSGPTEKQLKRLFAIAREAGVSNDDVKAYMEGTLGVASTKDLSREQYDQLCEAIQSGQVSGRTIEGDVDSMLPEEW